MAISDRRIGAGNAAEMIAGAGLVIDGTDNFATRLVVSDACVASGIPLLSAAVGRFQGQVAAFAGHLADQPCYRCFVGDAFDAEDCDTCAEDGILGAMVGWVGTFAAMQAVRLLHRAADGRSAMGQAACARRVEAGYADAFDCEGSCLPGVCMSLVRETAPQALFFITQRRKGAK